MRARLAVVAFLILLSACSGSESSAPTTTAPPPAVTPGVAATTTSAPAPIKTTTAAPPTTVEQTTTTTTPPTVPAGVQFSTSPELLPVTPGDVLVDGQTWVLSSTVDNGIIPCKVVSVCYSPQLNPVALVGNPATGFTTFAVDDITTLRAPSGTSVAHSLGPSSIAHSSLGWVMIGNAYFTDPLAHKIARQGVVWFSKDATTWTRTDPRDLIGDVSITLSDVAATDDGFTAVGSATAADLNAKSQGVVLHSSDGITWAASLIPGTYSTGLIQVLTLGSKTLVRGLEWICTSTSYGVLDFNVGGQDRLWQSTDGVSFDQVDLPSEIYTIENPAPADPAACAGLGFNAISQFSAYSGSMNVAGDRLFVFSTDGARVASTTDLADWTPTSLDGAGPDGSSLALVEGTGFSIARVQRPERDGQPLDFGLQGLGWRSDASASTFSRAPDTAPLLGLDPGPLRVQDDGSVLLIHTGAGADGTPKTTAWRSSSGPVVANPECSFTPGASCGLASLDGVDLSGKDLHGINLSGSTLTNVTLDGTNLAGAILVGVRVVGGSADGASLAGADLQKSDLVEAVLTGADLSLANLSGSRVAMSLFAGVTLTGAILQVYVNFGVPVDPAKLTFAGLNLSFASFGNFETSLADLTNTDWTGATLHSASFTRLDLTGANFTNADLTWLQVSGTTTMLGATVTGANIGLQRGGSVEGGASFADDVVCPDGGAPTTPDVVTFNPCRF